MSCFIREVKQPPEGICTKFLPVLQALAQANQNRVAPLAKEVKASHTSSPNLDLSAPQEHTPKTYNGVRLSRITPL